MLWMEQPDHPSVLALLKNGIPHSKVYSRKTPPYARRFVADMGNAEAETVTMTTPLEAWICTDLTEQSFETHRERRTLNTEHCFLKQKNNIAAWGITKRTIQSILFGSKAKLSKLSEAR